MKKFILKCKSLIALLLVITTISSVATPINVKDSNQNVVYTCGDESSWLIETR